MVITQNQTASIDMNSVFNFMFTMMIVIMMFRVVDRALEAPKERPKMLYPGKPPPGYKPVHHSQAEHHSEITSEEWRFAEGMWETTRENFIKGDRMWETTRENFIKGDPGGTYLWVLITRHYPENKDRQIRATGFMNEVAEKYRGRISREEAWRLARKWDVEKMLSTELMEFFPGESGHHSMWLTPKQRRELEAKYGAIAVRWAEELAPVGDVDFVERAAGTWLKKMKEAIGI